MEGLIKTFKAAFFFLGLGVVAVPILMLCYCAIGLAGNSQNKGKAGNELMCKECFNDNPITEFLLECKKPAK